MIKVFFLRTARWGKTFAFRKCPTNTQNIPSNHGNERTQTEVKANKGSEVDDSSADFTHYNLLINHMDLRLMDH